jgi:RHS repeat-associated protein
MSFTYNAAGSMLTKTESGSKTTYTHDFDQRLVKIVAGGTTYSYSYDGVGRRVKTYDGTTTSYFLYAGRRMLYSKVGTTQTAFVYAGDLPLFRKEGASSTPEARYYHSDLSGNVRLITYYMASNGINVDAKYRYRPFGDLITLTSPSADPRFKFAHQELDGSLRLYHMGARYQDPVVGRFIERDPIGPGYDYAANSPISFFDPTGMDVWSDIAGWLGGVGRAVLGGAVAVGNYLYESTVGAAINSYNWYIHASAEDQRAFWLGVLTACGHRSGRGLQLRIRPVRRATTPCRHRDRNWRWYRRQSGRRCRVQGCRWSIRRGSSSHNVLGRNRSRGGVCGRRRCGRICPKPDAPGLGGSART